MKGQVNGTNNYPAMTKSCNEQYTEKHVANRDKNITSWKQWVRYITVYLHELKSWRNGLLSLARGRETKKLFKKLKTEEKTVEITM